MGCGCVSPRSQRGRAGAADHRKATDNSGERRSTDRAGQQPFPSVRPGHPSTRIVSRMEEVTWGSVRAGSCRNGRVRASAVTSGRCRFKGTAGRQASELRTCDDAGSRFGLWSRRAGVRVPSVTQDRTSGAVPPLPVAVVNHPDRAGHAESVPTTTRRRPDRPGKHSMPL
jgi:hypothetical protein